MKFSKEQIRQSMLVYAVTDRHWLKPQEHLQDKVALALQGGATFVQIREKDLDETSFSDEAIQLQKLCASYQVPFVINDNVPLAVQLNCDGVHVGQSDMEASDVRALIGPDKILGVSANSVATAKKAEAAGADYIGVGAVFPTNSKEDAEAISHETLKEICRAVHIPVVAIGGITAKNLIELKDSGIDGIAVISAIFAQDDILSATKDLVRKMEDLL